MKAFQDYYPENLSHCYGCGAINDHGHRIKTYWDGDETVTRFKPEPYHTAVPGFTYGGLPAFRFVTGSLHVDYLKPNPINGTLEIRSRVKEIKGRKVVVEATVFAAGVATARGEIVAIQMPENFGTSAA